MAALYPISRTPFVGVIPWRLPLTLPDGQGQTQAPTAAGPLLVPLVLVVPTAAPPRPDRRWADPVTRGSDDHRLACCCWGGSPKAGIDEAFRAMLAGTIIASTRKGHEPMRAIVYTETGAPMC